MRIYLPLVLLMLAPACGSQETSSKKEAASTGAVSEGALCDHGVLEAICTKHNPKLITIFKSKGDYCEEHGFPMSVCPVHHPERGGRPAADVAADKAPPDGTKVRLKTPEAARLAGIKTVKAEKRPGGARLEALASITYDASKWAQVNARAAGVVREVKVDVGTMVKAGTPIAVIESASVGADRSRMRASGSRVAVAEANYKREKELLQQERREGQARCDQDRARQGRGSRRQGRRAGFARRLVRRARGSRIPVHAVRPQPRRCLQGDRRLVRGARPP